MTRRIVTFLVGVIAAATLATADEPAPDQPDAPVRLKKKKKADLPEPVKPDDKKDLEKRPEEKKPDKKVDDKPEPLTKDGEPMDAEEDEKEVLERVARNMKTVEERLVNKEINDSTRQLQDDIVKDLEALIKNAEDPQGGEQGNEEMQQGGNDNQDKEQGKQGQKGKSGSKKGMKKSGSQKGSAGKQKQKGNQGGPMQPGTAQVKSGEQEKSEGNGGKNPGKGGNNKDAPLDPARDADINKDSWGHLPETLRAQMNAYSSREKYMSKHQDLIKQYYKTIAAQGQRKGD